MAILTELSCDNTTYVTHPDTSYARGWQQAALCIAEKLTQVHSGERLTKSLDLVLASAVIFNPDGTATVRDGNHVYKINGQCTCEDARRRTIWCVHRLAAEIHKRATALLKGTRHVNAQELPNTASETTGTLSGAEQNYQPPSAASRQALPTVHLLHQRHYWHPGDLLDFAR